MNCTWKTYTIHSEKLLSPMNILSTAYNCYYPKYPPTTCVSVLRTFSSIKPGGKKATHIHRETDVGIHIGELLYCLLFKCVLFIYANIEEQEKCRKKELNQNPTFEFKFNKINKNRFKDHISICSKHLLFSH